MKRFYISALAMPLLLSMAACGTVQKSGTAVQFYYQMDRIANGTETGVIAAESRYFTNIDVIEDIIAIYLAGPEAETLQSPFPADLTLQSMTLTSTSLDLVFSDHIAQKSGIDLTIACACIQKTIKNLTGIDTINIYAENEKINNQDVITLRSSSLLMVDTEISNPTHLEKNQ